MDRADLLFGFCCRMGDNTLILGHRISEWCGVAPVLEEDIALANTALDLIGQTQMWLGLAAETSGAGKTADDLAMKRDVMDFHNLLLVERPNGDFGCTMMRQFLFDIWHLEMLKALQSSSEQSVADIAAKAVKEVSYHAERSSDTVIRLGDGTPESHKRMQNALDLLWPFAGEMVTDDPTDIAISAAEIAPLPSALKETVQEKYADVFAQATLTQPESSFAHRGGKSGTRHTEHLGHLLTQMQWLQRAYPGASW